MFRHNSTAALQRKTASPDARRNGLCFDLERHALINFLFGSLGQGQSTLLTKARSSGCWSARLLLRFECHRTLLVHVFCLTPSKKTGINANRPIILPFLSILALWVEILAVARKLYARAKHQLVAALADTTNRYALGKRKGCLPHLVQTSQRGEPIPHVKWHTWP